MTVLQINNVTPVRVKEQFTGLSGSAISAASPVVYAGPADGKYRPADATGASPLRAWSGVSVRSVNGANLAMTVISQGIVDLGDALDSMDFNDPIYLDEVGALADAPTASPIIVGRVIPGWGAVTADKLMHVRKESS
jgi:hypothetical protein